MQFFKRKDDQRLPDTYKMTFRISVRESIVYETASHRYVDRIIETNEQDETIAIFAAPVPYWELRTVEDKICVVPVTNSLVVEFDENWSKIVAIREEEAEKKRKVAGKKRRVAEEQRLQEEKRLFEEERRRREEKRKLEEEKG